MSKNEKLQGFLKELEREALTTRKMLQRVPDNKYDWKPHEKSMTLQRLANHVAEIPGWVAMILTTTELDFAKGSAPTFVNNNAELMAFFEASLEQGRSHLKNGSDDQLNDLWSMRNGEEVYSTSTKEEVIRMSFCQIVHHRAQLGVYLRLLDIPIPASYGPSADDMSFN